MYCKNVCRLIFVLFPTLIFAQNGFNIEASPADVQDVVRDGDPVTFQIAITSTGSFTQQLHLTAYPQVPGINCTFSSNDLFYPYNQGLTMKLSATASAQLGIFYVLIVAANGPIGDTTKVTVHVKNDTCLWTTYPNYNGWQGTTAHFRLATDKYGTLWIAGNGLRKYSNGVWTDYYPQNPTLPVSYMNDLCLDENGKIHIATNGGYCTFDSSYWTIYDSLNSPISDSKFYSIVRDNTGTVWLASNSGIYSFDGTFWNRYQTTLDGVSLQNAKKLQLDKIGHVYALCGDLAHGVTTISYGDRSSWRSLSVVNQIFNTDNKAVGDFAFDTLNNLWMVGRPAEHLGLIKYDNHNIEQWYYNDTGMLSHIVKDSSGTVIYGNNACLMPGRDAHGVFVDNRNIVWLTCYSNDDQTSNGVTAFNGQGWRTYTYGDKNFPSNGIMNFTTFGKKIVCLSWTTRYDWNGPYNHITSNSCEPDWSIPDTTVTYAYSFPTAIDENSPLHPPLKLYPNPVNDVLNVEWSTLMDLQAEVLLRDMQGRLILQIRRPGLVEKTGILQIPTGSLASGVYQLQILNKQSLHCYKIIKN